MDLLPERRRGRKAREDDGDGASVTKHKKRKEEMKELGHINPFSTVPVVNTFDTYTGTTEPEAAANRCGAIHRKGGTSLQALSHLAAASHENSCESDRLKELLVAVFQMMGTGHHV